MGVHILCLFLSAAGPLEEQKHTPGTAQQTTSRGGGARTKSPSALWKACPGKEGQSQGSTGLKKHQESRTKAKITKLQWSSRACCRLHALCGFPYIYFQKGNTSLAYKNYRLASNFNLYPLKGSLSLGIALCRANCSSGWFGFERGKQFKLFSLSRDVLLSHRIPVKGKSFAKGFRTCWDCTIPTPASPHGLLFLFTLPVPRALVPLVLTLVTTTCSYFL